jgi:hypothetical protein
MPDNHPPPSSPSRHSREDRATPYQISRRVLCDTRVSSSPSSPSTPRSLRRSGHPLSEWRPEALCTRCNRHRWLDTTQSSVDQIGWPGGVSVGGKEGRRKRGARAFKGGLGEAISGSVVCGRWGSGRGEYRG